MWHALSSYKSHCWSKYTISLITIVSKGMVYFVITFNPSYTCML